MKLVTPRGMRDILPDEALERESVIEAINSCFRARGYLPVETPAIELVDMLRVGGKDVAESSFKLFDLDGKLLGLRPDMTLPIARLASSRLLKSGEQQRLRYCAPVFREHESLRGQARQFTQMGIELINASGPAADAEIIILMAEAYAAAGLSSVRLSIGTVAILEAILNHSHMSADWKSAVVDAAHSRNFVRLCELATQPDVPANVATVLCELNSLRGGFDAIERCAELTKEFGCEGALNELIATLEMVDEAGLRDSIEVDFSVMRPLEYYTGIVIEANIDGLGTALGGGGRYDNTYAAYGTPASAAGFAIGLERVITARGDLKPASDERPLRIAVPKGSLFKESVDILSRAGLETGDLSDPGRLLKVEAPGVEYLIVRPTDIPAFVAYGGADCAIAGKDTLVEAGLEVAELLDLSFGACRFVVAEPNAVQVQAQKSPGARRVATKYPNITAAYFDELGEQVEIIKLHGNIELAPLINMADCIVDITATGTTLRENDLRVTGDVMESSARFVANPAALRCDPRVVDLAQSLSEVLMEEGR